MDLCIVYTLYTLTIPIVPTTDNQRNKKKKRNKQKKSENIKGTVTSHKNKHLAIFSHMYNILIRNAFRLNWWMFIQYMTHYRRIRICYAILTKKEKKKKTEKYHTWAGYNSTVVVVHCPSMANDERLFDYLMYIKMCVCVEWGFCEWKSHIWISLKTSKHITLLLLPKIPNKSEWFIEWCICYVHHHSP